jgi:hypothetical protein
VDERGRLSLLLTINNSMSFLYSTTTLSVRLSSMPSVFWLSRTVRQMLYVRILV